MVDKSAKHLLEWIGRSGNCKVRGLFEIAAQSGLSYSAWVDHQVVSAYVSEGGGKDTFVADAAARLCQGAPAKRQKTMGSRDNPFKTM